MVLNISGVAMVITAALFLSFLVERIAEYILLPILDLIVGMVANLARGKPLSLLEAASEYKLVGQTRMVTVSVMNFILYITLLGYDFMTPLLKPMGVSVAEIPGLVLSSLIVAGGSNFVHDLFTKLKSREDEATPPSPQMPLGI